MAKAKTTKAKRPGPGRPPGKDPVPAKKADAVIEWISAGKALRTWCLENKVGASTVYDWTRKDADFAARFTHARAAGGAMMLDLSQEIADGKPGVSSDDVARDKLRVDTLHKRAANFAPHLYGTKVQVGGTKDAEPIKVEAKGPTVPDTASLIEGIAKLQALALEHFGK